MNSPAHFTVDPRVATILGENYSSSERALRELIDNACDAGVRWDGIVARQRQREEQRSKGSVVPDFVPAALEQEVEVMRSTVLNKLSHTGPYKGQTPQAPIRMQR